MSDAVTQALKEQGLDQTFELKAIACDGIEACRMALLKASKKVLPATSSRAWPVSAAALAAPAA